MCRWLSEIFYQSSATCVPDQPQTMPNRDSSADKHIKEKVCHTNVRFKRLVFLRGYKRISEAMASSNIRFWSQRSSRKISIAENELEPVHMPVRYRRLHRTRRHSRVNGEFEESDKNGNSNGVAPPKKSSKYSVQKKIDRLVEENRILTMKLENSNMNPGKFSLIMYFIMI